MKAEINKNNDNTYDPRLAPAGSLWGEVVRRFFKNKIAVASLALFLIICLACLFAPYLTKYEYYGINIAIRSSRPSFQHLLGTDVLGRDNLTRMLYGGRLTLKITFLSTIIAAAIGSILGLAAGYAGKKADYIISPVLDLLAAVPVVLLSIVCETIFGWGKGYFMYAIAVASVPKLARFVRASVLEVMGREYIEAARALGVSHVGVIFRHVVHNVAPSFIVRLTSSAAEALVTCTIMGYLSIGISPPTPEWGQIAHNAKAYMRVAPFMMLIPCIVIAVTVLSLSLFGDGLRDALDPNEAS